MNEPGKPTTTRGGGWGVWLAFALVLLAAPCLAGPTNVLTNTLPTSLPIGSSRRFYDYLATNSELYVSIGIGYTDTNDVQKFPMWSWGTVNKLTNFEQLEEYLVGCSISTFDIQKTKMKSESPIYTSWTVFGPSPAYLETFAIINVYVGKKEEITSNSFMTLPLMTSMTLQVSCIWIPVSNLERFQIQVRTNDSPYANTYKWTWPDDPPFTSTSTRPDELTSSGSIVMNAWYSTNCQQWARFTAVAGGFTNTYTQGGDLIVPPKVTIISTSLVRVEMTPGTDTTIQSSSDLVHWTTEKSLPWSWGTNVSTVAVSPSPAQRFFRAFSQ